MAIIAGMSMPKKNKQRLLRRRPEVRAKRASKDGGAILRGPRTQFGHRRVAHDKVPISDKSEIGARAPQNDAAREWPSALQPAALHRLLAWLSPAYPVGAFSYSSGIEWAVEAGDIRDAESLKAWLAVMIARGAGYCDAVFFVHAHRAALAGDDSTLGKVAELAAAFAPSKERHLESTAQGRAFVEATRAAWPCAALDTLEKIWDGPVAYPVAVGVAAAGHGIALQPALHAYLHAVTVNWISAGIRLIPLGQTDGQRVLAALEAVVAATAQRALATALDDIGSAAFRADLASARHETQYTRLFRS